MKAERRQAAGQGVRAHISVSIFLATHQIKFWRRDAGRSVFMDYPLPAPCSLFSTLFDFSNPSPVTESENLNCESLLTTGSTNH